MGEIRIGTSGWNYPSGNGTWNGVFYPAFAHASARQAPSAKASARQGRAPKASARQGKFDELRFYAEHFDTVEINSTFYRVPSVATAKSWVERTPANFEFSLKLYQKFTHPKMFEKATGGDASTLGQKDVDEFRAMLDPVAKAGKLGALLAQFPASFKNDSESRAYLEILLQQFRDYRVAVELRHRSWSDRPEDTLNVLGEHGAAWTQIDEPKFKLSIRQNLLPNVRTFYYLRLHGRNAAQWWAHKNSEDRYDYLYSADELKPFAEAAETASKKVEKAYLYANNHFSAKSVANAAILKHDLGQNLPGEYPPAFLERYPDLKGIVKELPPTLLDTPS